MPFTVDKTNPENAAAFEGCKVGDKYEIEVTEDTPDSITFDIAPEEPEEAAPEKGPRGAGAGDYGGEGGGNPAIAILAMPKRKMGK